MSYELTRAQRDEIRAGGAPPITWEGQTAPVEPGDELAVASNLTIRIDRLHRRRDGAGGYTVAEYTIRDLRVQLMRRVPPMFAPPDLDEYGDPKPVDAELIERARHDGAVTSSSALAVPGDAGEVVPGEYENVIRMRSRLNRAQHRTLERAEEQARQDAKRIAATIRDQLIATARAGGDPSVYLAGLERAARQEDAA